MHTIVRPFAITIPAGTLKTAPLVTLTQFSPDVVEHVQWRFPNGCNGFVGIQLGARGVPVFPQGALNFLVHNGSVNGYDLEDHHTTGDWSIIAYNLGTFPHTVYVEFRTRRNPKEPPLPGYLRQDAVALLQGAE